MDGDIYHIVPRVEWEAATGDTYRPAGFAAEGFIHCSGRAQVLATANALFAGREDLLLLVIDAGQVAADLVYEDLYGAGEAFPHIYAPLPAAAVRRVLSFPCGADGRFYLPAGA